ncbi:hypothetical protein NQ314_012856 [Rhamnusium bicolor]|uniref:rRNA biogenesis protein RRP36 n=1 Tax=Rhamnusium bicolor TaxID=1586634 RepID=A0AAV8XAF5_9CUCU|nr:hypothetical protein NQ314_012856 [Rhamnusium bicolor]
MSDTEFENNSIFSKTSRSEELETTEQERANIREQISTLSFEELLKMKEKIGSKLYNETVFGVMKKHTKQGYKRANKNRPREMSSKIKVKKLKQELNTSILTKKSTPRDPRFDPLCGEFDNKTFKSNYKFDNQIREQQKKEMENRKEYNEKISIREKLRKGEKPVFKKKSVKKLESLIEKYEELKKTNKLQKHIEKRSKNLSSRERTLETARCKTIENLDF